MSTTVEVQQLREQWSEWIRRTAAGEPLVITFRKRPQAALIPHPVWIGHCEKTGTTPVVVEMTSGPARQDLAERRDAALERGEHTVIRDGNSKRDLAVLTPYEWALEATGIEPIGAPTQQD